jgi:anti-sigma factor RsiW
MMGCHEVEPLLTAYIDREVDGRDRAAIAAHLDGCPACRRRASAEHSARTLLRARASDLGCRASESLRARCHRAAGRRSLVERFQRSSFAMPLSMAAAVLLVLLMVFSFSLFGRSTRALAAQLTLDHLKCFALSSEGPGSVQAAAVRQTFSARNGWNLTVPESSSAEHVTLVGSRQCLSGEGRVAHVLYRREGHPVSVFFLPHTVHAEEKLEIMGHIAVIWSRSDMTYVVLARQPRADAEEVARYVKASVGGRR